MKKTFFHYVLQSTLGMIGISVYILADTFFISISGGADGITVLNLMLPLYGLLYAIGAMIGIGSATKFAIRRQQKREADHYFTHSLAWQFLASLPFILIGLISPGRYLGFMGGDARIVSLGTGYARIVFLAAPCFMMNFTFTAFARNDKAPTTAMIASLSGSLFNIIFDYIFMFPLGMGMKGAALATSLSPVVTSMVTLTHYLGKNNTIHPSKFSLSLRRLVGTCQLGFSAFVGEISSAITTTIFNTLLLSIAGNTGVAAYGVIANLALVATALFNGVAQGVQPLLSTSYGKNNFREIRQLLRLGIITALLLETCILGIAYGFTDQLVHIFNSENNLLLAQYAHAGLRLYFLGYILAGVNILLVNYFSAIADVRTAFLASILRGVAAIALCAIVLSRLFGMTGIWLSFPAAECITLLSILGCSLRRRAA
ncbi:MAG: MATE family efflux transporter [Eubacteriales bacterium]|nr:MATE family efflux transporter [Eubacteriales bacterium]